jgi:hypothetical protein
MLRITRVANNEEMKYGTRNKGDEDESPPQAKIFWGDNWVARCI